MFFCWELQNGIYVLLYVHVYFCCFLEEGRVLSDRPPYTRSAQCENTAVVFVLRPRDPRVAPPQEGVRPFPSEAVSDALLDAVVSTGTEPFWGRPACLPALPAAGASPPKATQVHGMHAVCALRAVLVLNQRVQIVSSLNTPSRL